MNLQKFGGVEGGFTLAFDRNGREHVVVVGKATFDIGEDGTCALAAQQPLVATEDEHYGDPASTCVRYECDFALHKPFADLVVNGSAYAPPGCEAKEVIVGLVVGSRRKFVRVLGDRVWTRTLLGCKPSEPRPFTRMSLRYERAFGGSDSDPKDPKSQVVETRNLAGVGYFSSDRPEVVGSPVPNLEHLDHPVRSCTRRGEPVGFGFVSRNWQPRLAFAGTYDENWREHQFPYLPEDFDTRYFQGAPIDQQFPHFLGGELIQIINMTPEGRMAFEVPSFPMAMYLVLRTEHLTLAPVLDTLLLEPDMRRATAVWRAHVATPCKLTDILEVWVGSPSKGRLSAMVQQKRYLDLKSAMA